MIFGEALDLLKTGIVYKAVKKNGLNHFCFQNTIFLEG